MTSASLLVYNTWLDRTRGLSAVQLAFHAPHAARTIHAMDETLQGLPPWSDIANDWKLYLQRPATGCLHVFLTRPGALVLWPA